MDRAFQHKWGGCVLSTGWEGMVLRREKRFGDLSGYTSLATLTKSALVVLAVTMIPCTARVFPMDGRCYPTGEVRHYVFGMRGHTRYSVWRDSVLVCPSVWSTRLGSLTFLSGSTGRYCIAPADSAGCP